MHSWLTDIPKNKCPSVFTFKYRDVFSDLVLIKLTDLCLGEQQES